MKKNVIFLILSIVLAVVSTILILVFDETETELGSEIAAVFLILSVACISIFSKKIRKSARQNIQTQQSQQFEQPQQPITNNKPQVCEYCGATNQANANKCSSCGARLQ